MKLGLKTPLMVTYTMVFTASQKKFKFYSFLSRPVCQSLPQINAGNTPMTHIRHAAPKRHCPHYIYILFL